MVDMYCSVCLFDFFPIFCSHYSFFFLSNMSKQQEKQQDGVGSDPQLQTANGFSEGEPLLEVMLKKFHSMYRENADPFILRVVIAGERSENAAHSLGVLMSELVDAAMESSENPLCENNDSPMKPSGVLIDYENVFIELIEGYERHIVQYLKLLHNHCEHKESAHCSNVQVLFLTDDVPTPTTPFFGFVDKVPAITEDGGIQEKTDEEFAEMIVADVHRLMELASLAANEPTNKRKMFLDNVRVTRPLLFPLTSSIRSYLAKDFCFTLGEYVKVFGSIPVLTRDVELNHPAEDPLKY